MNEFKIGQVVVSKYQDRHIHKGDIGIVLNIDSGTQYNVYLIKAKRTIWADNNMIKVMDSDAKIDSITTEYVNTQFQNVKTFLKTFRGQYRIDKGEIKSNRCKPKDTEVNTDGLPF